MPNWCFNYMNINVKNKSGKILAEAFRPKYKEYNEYLKADELYAKPFQDLLPCPEDLQITATSGNGITAELDEKYKANTAKYGYPNWYEWQINNWGTKWDARVTSYQESGEWVNVNFETAWSPPVEFLRWFATQYPDVEFDNEYDEEGMFFEGKTTNDSDGFRDQCWEPKGDPEEIEE